MNHPIRIDDPALSGARLTRYVKGDALDALREHVGNILSRLSNEAQAQLLAADLWDAEAEKTGDETHASAGDRCGGRAEALAWAQAAIASAFDLAVRPIPFEVPPQWNTLPPDTTDPDRRLIAKTREQGIEHKEAF